MIQKIIQTYLTALYLFITLVCFTGRYAIADDNESAYGLTNFAFASYLGTGFYTTSGQDVFVFRLPFYYTIKEKTDNQGGWVLNLPLTFGLIDFDKLRELDYANLPDLGDVTTLTFMPGIEYHHPVTAAWTLIPFADYGLARDLNHSSNVFITGIGIKSYADFRTANSNTLTLGNKFIYARESSIEFNSASDYSLIETGLNYRITGDNVNSFRHIRYNFYYINFYYPDELVFLERTGNPVRVGIEHEIGFTVSQLPDFLFFDKPQIGFGIRRGNNVDVYRLLFSAPF